MTSYFSLEYTWSLQQLSTASFGFYWGFQPLQKLHKWGCLCLPYGVFAPGKRKSRKRGIWLPPTLCTVSTTETTSSCSDEAKEKIITWLHFPICKRLAMMFWKRRKKKYFTSERKTTLKRKWGREGKWRKNTR